MRYAVWKKMGLTMMLATMTRSTVMPAEARRRNGWNQNRPRNNDRRVAGAVVGEVLALGIGAAIASSVNSDNRRRDYEDNLRQQDYYQDGDADRRAQPAYETPITRLAEPAATRIAGRDSEFNIAFKSLDADGDGKVWLPKPSQSPALTTFRRCRHETTRASRRQNFMPRWSPHGA